MSLDREVIAASKAWPIVEAQRLLERVDASGRRPRASCCSRPATGRRACRISAPSPRCSAPRWCARRSRACRDLPTELYAFSDDMDGLRKVPDNVPNQAMVAEHLGRPLTAIPDPFGTHESYGAHMNARLQAFLDAVRLRLHLQERQRGVSQGHVQRGAPQGAGAARCRSARSCCRRWGRSGAPPTARSCRSRPRPAACCRCRSRNAGPLQGTVVFRDEDGTLTEVPVTDGHCKMQWKCDWALRWAALDVDYEMSGKDLIDSVKLSTQDLPPARRRAAREPHLRAVPGRAGPEDQQVQGQRADHRGMAALRHAREPAALPLPRAAEGQAPALRRDPAQRRRLRGLPRGLPAASCRPSRSATRSGTSTTAGRRWTTGCRPASPSACS